MEWLRLLREGRCQVPLGWLDVRPQWAITFTFCDVWDESPLRT